MKESGPTIDQTPRTDQTSHAWSDFEAAEAELSSESARLKDENERLQAELRHLNELHIRNLADFDNYRRRLEGMRGRAAQAGKRELILPLLELIDDFERTLLQLCGDTDPIATQLHAIHRRLVELLGEQGVTAFNSQGKQFNPLLHEAVDYVRSEGAEPGTVIEEISRGWQCGGELLRSARVRVAR